MKRVVAVSDSHGRVGELRRVMNCAMARGPVDVAVFLGDGLGDWETVAAEMKAAHPGIMLYAVRGNNDWGRATPETQVFNVGSVRFFACHGHEWHVKYGYYRLEAAAREQEARVALFGHTHCSCLEPGPECTLINPGAVCDGSPRKPLYAEILVEEDGRLRADLVFH